MAYWFDEVMYFQEEECMLAMSLWRFGRVVPVDLVRRAGGRKSFHQFTTTFALGITADTRRKMCSIMLPHSWLTIPCLL